MLGVVGWGAKQKILGKGKEQMIDLYKLLETLEMTVSYLPVKTATLSEVEETIAELRQALAQPEQKPVAWQDPQYKTLIEPHKAHPDWIPLYTAPPSIEAAVLAEREACAKVCDLAAKEIDDTNGIATYCAAAIRARSEK